MMKTKWAIFISVILAAAVLGLGLLLEPQFPDPMVTHWGSGGQPNGYGSHFIGIWLIPLMIVGLTGLFGLIPIIDPLRENISKFLKEYNIFIIGFSVYMVYVQVLTLIWNLGYEFNLGSFMLPVMGILFYLLGVLIGKARRNYFVGIRTPWTLQDERVWNETHQLGAKVFKVSGLLALVGVFFPTWGFLLFLVPILAGSIYIVIYSYVLYRRYHPSNNH